MGALFEKKLFYKLNIWYDPHAGSMILNCFVEDHELLGACSTFVADWSVIALPPGAAFRDLRAIRYVFELVRSQIEIIKKP